MICKHIQSPPLNAFIFW